LPGLLKKSCAFVEQGKGLSQTVSTESCLDALVACKERVAAIRAFCLSCVGLQFLALLQSRKEMNKPLYLYTACSNQSSKSPWSSFNRHR